MARPTVYGIPNCEQIKKTLAWFAAKRIDIEFHDYKKAGIDSERLERWVKKVGTETLLNRKGTTWRKLAPAAQAAAADDNKAIALMLEQPSLIKRPVVVAGAQIQVGYDPQSLEAMVAPK